ncbi:PREDICTED: dimethylaniline monooxygenase [N-oxide-forming] 2 isoform X2 [Rhinopithecus bieti]|uniref:dimethylaniline monooxygenase [N-oxide-forming] 2 isoform X2 n=1 Tax=Rhinopithecus bieti TaxID=61621 RepID=UPI00083BB60E|nr:PREDICTED: dimethylaniline monooxygenase [N-oxide-forming] 2 isoform X2 [Rhinopithecus bieti]
MAKKVAVIGAGVSGLISLKCCVDEGLEPTCFERTEDIGGVWRFKEKVEDGRASIYQSVITNTSKEMSCFSDFPMPEDFPNFLHNSKLLEYFRIFAKKFDLLKYIQFQVFISTRHGTWVVSRVSEDGYPWDSVFHTRFRSMLRNVLPQTVVKWMIEQQMNRWFNHENYGLEPQNKYIMKEPVLNDDVPSRLLCGAIKVKSTVKELTETSAIFEDGTVEENIDVIIFATGYSFSFPFLEDSLVKVENNMVSLYKYIFPAHLEKSTFACIGLIQPLGSIFPTAELQARWVTRVFKGLCSLPSERTMMMDIIKRNEKRIDLFGESQSQTLQTNYVDYLDELALEIGAKPDFCSLLFKDPKLAVRLYFGPCNSYQYRLAGPGQWEGARSAIFTQKQRILKPLKTRVLKDSSNFPVSFLLKILGLLAVVVAFFCQLQWS